jgi:hypothetical protein
MSIKIHRVPSPAICVIDDEVAEYEPILKALLRMGLGAVHIKGDNLDDLPPEGHPLQGLRLVFTDLNLNNSSNRMALSNTATVFSRVVPSDSGPVIVIIWSKIADDADDSAEGITKAQEFQNLVLNGHPSYRNKLIFTQMEKPKGMGATRKETIDWITRLENETRHLLVPSDCTEPLEGELTHEAFLDRFSNEFDRLAGQLKQEFLLEQGTNDDSWVDHFQKKVTALLSSWESFDLLWKWESVCQRAAGKAGHDLLHLALRALPPESTNRLNEAGSYLQQILQELVRAQGGSDIQASDAPRHLVTALAELAADNIEHSDRITLLEDHAEWLTPPKRPPDADFGPAINRVLLTSEFFAAGHFVPGSVFEVKEQVHGFESLFGCQLEKLKVDCLNRSKKSFNQETWKASATPVVVEISPACDVHNNKRRTIVLLAGLVVDGSQVEFTHSKDAWMTLPQFEPREPPAADGQGNAPNEAGEEPKVFELRGSDQRKVFMVFCARYRATLPVNADFPLWLKPWFRLRDLPTAAVRNWAAGQSARVGYISL